MISEMGCKIKKKSHFSDYFNHLLTKQPQTIPKVIGVAVRRQVNDIPKVIGVAVRRQVNEAPSHEHSSPM